MKILTLTISLLLIGATCNLQAQENKQQQKYGSGERANAIHMNEAKNGNQDIKDLETPQLQVSKPEGRVVSTDGGSEFPKPATKTTSNKKMNEISYSLDNNNSPLNNLLMLIEIKEKVNEEINSNLKHTKEYDKLLNDISDLKSKFNLYVSKKGLKNCTQIEQSHYLAFLKEEGKEEEYKEAMNTLK